jgi:hypothetical protein
LYWRGGPGANSEAGRTSSSNGRVAYATSSSSDTNAGAKSCRGGTDSLSARVAARSAARGSRVLKKNRPISLVPPLPYKVDTSRPSLRTNWTRLVPFPRAARGSARALRPQDPRGFHRSLEPFDVSSAPPRWPGRGVRLVCTERWRDVRPVCMGGGEMCVRSVRGEGLASVSRGQCFDDAWISGSGACDPASERTPSFSARAAAGTDTCGAGGQPAFRPVSTGGGRDVST